MYYFLKIKLVATFSWCTQPFHGYIKVCFRSSWPNRSNRPQQSCCSARSVLHSGVLGDGERPPRDWAGVWESPWVLLSATVFQGYIECPSDCAIFTFFLFVFPFLTLESKRFRYSRQSLHHSVRPGIRHKVTYLGTATVNVWIPQSIAICLNDPCVPYHSGKVSCHSGSHTFRCWQVQERESGRW